MDQRSFELVRDPARLLFAKDMAGVVSAINRALHHEGITKARVERIRWTELGCLLSRVPPPAPPPSHS